MASLKLVWPTDPARQALIWDALLKQDLPAQPVKVAKHAKA